ncbi:MAG: hypothetical protein Q8O28_10765, partial [Smithellaceae bacterium]|nr:hypothetical protein [Smithellaceae bacterium]
CVFTSGCSPPRLTATQLPSVTEIGHNLGGGFSPPKSRLLPGALIPAQAGIHSILKSLDSRLRGNDKSGSKLTIYGFIIIAVTIHKKK